jgi:hypothetical protein
VRELPRDIGQGQIAKVATEAPGDNKPGAFSVWWESEWFREWEKLVQQEQNRYEEGK